MTAYDTFQPHLYLFHYYENSYTYHFMLNFHSSSLIIVPKIVIQKLLQIIFFLIFSDEEHALTSELNETKKNNSIGLAFNVITNSIIWFNEEEYFFLVP